MDMEPHLSLGQPSPWVIRFAPLIGSGEVLDLACGSGRHARWLAAKGYRVLGVDRDAAALTRLRNDGIAVLQVDLEAGDAAAWPFSPEQFAGIVVTNYLHRPLFPKILDSLAPGGVLIYETFALGNERFGKPSNPDFLLHPGELLAFMQLPGHPSMRVIAYEDGHVEQPKPAMVQRLCAIKSDGNLQPSKLRLA